MLKQRVVTAIVLVALLIPILFFLPPWAAVVAFALVATAGAWEWTRLIPAVGSARVLFPTALLALCGMSFLSQQAQLALCQIAAVFWLAFVPVWLVRRWRIPAGVLGLFVGGLVLLPAWIGMVRLHAVDPWLLLAVMALVWVADISAYFVGRAFGRHKLAPAISPGKTWEGALGALFGALAYVFLLQKYTTLPLPKDMWVLLPGTIVLVAVSIAGDLFESMIKRQAGVKDSSQLLPGHGGVLDRIDSLTSTLPLVVAASALWLV